MESVSEGWDSTSITVVTGLFAYHSLDKNTKKVATQDNADNYSLLKISIIIMKGSW